MAPAGYLLIANNVSRFEEGRKTAVIKEENVKNNDYENTKRDFTNNRKDNHRNNQK
jgi:hypothetical protein